MIRVGQVVGAFGIQGAVRVTPLTDFDDRFATGSNLVLEGVPRRVEWSRQQPAGLVLKLTGIDTRTLAEMHRGRYLEVPMDTAHRLPEDTWYHHQLVGLRVRSESGRELGRLVEILERPANDVWVAREGNVEQLIPATREAILSVDVAGGLVRVADWVLEVEEA